MRGEDLNALCANQLRMYNRASGPEKSVLLAAAVEAELVSDHETTKLIWIDLTSNVPRDEQIKHYLQEQFLGWMHNKCGSLANTLCSMMDMAWIEARLMEVELW